MRLSTKLIIALALIALQIINNELLSLAVFCIIGLWAFAGILEAQNY